MADWRDCAGRHWERVHQAAVEPEVLALEHVQANEFRGKGSGMIFWLCMAMMVGTRLWPSWFLLVYTTLVSCRPIIC